MNQAVKIIVLVGLMSLFGCSASIEDEYPGVCELKCEGASIGSSNDFRFKPTSEIGKITCIGPLTKGQPSDLGGPITIQMLAERPRTVIYDTPFEDPERTEHARWQAVGGLSFEPIVTGVMAGSKTSTENAVVDGNEVTPFKYAGIVTPKTEWCTDTCGVATLEVWPACVGDTDVEVTIQFHSGGLYSDVMQFEVSHEN